MSWIKNLRAQFAVRQELAIEQLYSVFDLSQNVGINEASDALKQFEYEYGVPIGLLRPDDSLEHFLEPPREGNSWSQIVSRLGAGDRGGELNLQLIKHRKELGVNEIPAQVPRTLREFVLAWAGIDDSAADEG